MAESHEGPDLKRYASAAELPDGEYALIDLGGSNLLAGSVAVHAFGTKPFVNVRILIEGHLAPATNLGLSIVSSVTFVSKELAWSSHTATRAPLIPIAVVLQLPYKLQGKLLSEIVDASLRRKHSPEDVLRDMLSGRR